MERNGKSLECVVVETEFDPEEEEKKPFTLLISQDTEIKIKALDGEAIITYAKKTFKSYIDEDFDTTLHNYARSTQETSVDVSELNSDATFLEIFLSISNNLDQLILTQSQIIFFCEERYAWLRSKGGATFFLLKDGGKYFVVVVHSYSDGLSVILDTIKNKRYWSAEKKHRIVYPKLKLK